MLTPIFILFPLCAAFSITILKPLLAQESIEHIIQLNPRQPNRLQFTLKKNGPLWIAITPCGGTIHWQLFHNHIFDYDNELGAKLQGLCQHKNRKEGSEELKVSSESKLLAGEADEKRMIYFSKKVEKGLLTIVLSSNVQSSVRVFFTTMKRKLDWQYPAKPYDSTVVTSLLPNTDGENTTAINVKWNIPLEIEAISRFNQGSQASKRYRFCVTMSRKLPEWTICDELGENLESIHCVNQTTNNLQISKLKKGNVYYATVFIRDILSGGTTALEPTEVFIPAAAPKTERHKREKLHKLLDAKLRVGKLSARQGSVQSYQFHVHRTDADQQKILIALYSCNGYIRIAISRKGRQIYRSNSFTGYHRFLVTDIVGGYITIDIINDDEKPKRYRIWASTAPQKTPYPQLPEDTSIKTIKRSCSSVTLQWMKSHNTKVRYCLYKRKEVAQFIDELISKTNDFCQKTVPDSELVECHTVYTKPEAFVLKPMLSSTKSNDYEGDMYNPIFETTVAGLQPKTTYRFDLLTQSLHRPNTQQLPYRTVWARTLNC